jgi:hypothetical protein
MLAACGAASAYPATARPASTRPGTGTHPAGALRPTSAGWGNAQQLNGFAALPGHGKDINPSITLSCAARGNCTGGGSYFELDALPDFFPIVVSEAHGAWGNVRLAPGVAALQKGRESAVGAVSCAAPGDYCGAAGTYSVVPASEAGPSASQVFVASQVGGTWRPASPLPGFAALDTGRQGTVTLSCAGPGSCAAAGAYTVKGARGGEHERAVIADEVRGRWQRARQPKGAAFLNAGGSSRLVSVSCAAPGTCAAGGTYTGAHEITHAFVISEAHGSWGRAQAVRGVSAPSSVSSVSCAAPGACTAVGSSGNGRSLFAVSEVGGRWGSAQPLPGIAALNMGPYARVTAVACAEPGDCAAGGTYALGPSVNGAAPPTAAFVVSEVHGAWRRAIAVPGTAAVNAGRTATVTDVSCAPAGPCTAVGYYSDARDRPQSFIVSEQAGNWARAQGVPGLTALGGYSSTITSVSCPAAHGCTAAGHYLARSGKGSAARLFVISEH